MSNRDTAQSGGRYSLTFAMWLVWRRTVLDMSKTQLAKSLHVSHLTISGWETQGICPTLSAVEGIERALGPIPDEIKEHFSIEPAFKIADTDFARWLVENRRAKGWLRIDVSEATGIAWSVLQCWEEKGAYPLWRNLQKIEALFGKAPKREIKPREPRQFERNALNRLGVVLQARKNSSLATPLSIWLTEQRLRLSWPLKESAARLGISTTTLLQWENGKNRPRLDKLDEIRRLYGEVSEELVKYFNEPRKPSKLRDSNPFADWLCQSRRTLGLKVKEVVEHLGIFDKESVYRWEYGSGTPRLEKALFFQDLYGPLPEEVKNYLNEHARKARNVGSNPLSQWLIERRLRLQLTVKQAASELGSVCSAYALSRWEQGIALFQIGKALEALEDLYGPMPTRVQKFLPEVINEKISDLTLWLVCRRREQKLSTVHAANLLNVSTNVLYQWEHGVSVPDHAQVQAIKALYGAMPAEVLHEIVKGQNE